MPSRNQGRNRERRQFPDLKDAIGYDPARYLDVPLLETGIEGTPKIRVAISMIQGISRLGVANAWIAAERRLERAGDPDDPDKPDPGPREQIMALLEAKVDYLVEHGDRPRELPTEDGPRRYRKHNRDRPPAECVLIRREVLGDELEVVDRVPIEEVRERTAKVKIENKRADSTTR